MNWTLKHIEQLKASGKIRGYLLVNPDKKADLVGGRKVVKHFPKRSKEKDFVAWNLLIWSQENTTPLEEEYVFHPERGWQFDWCLPGLMIAIEYEGGIFMQKSGHTNLKGIKRDIEKYNAAQVLGWRVVRIHAHNYKTVITEIKKLL